VKKRRLVSTLALLLVACQGSDIEIFAPAATAGSGGASGSSAAGSAGSNPGGGGALDSAGAGGAVVDTAGAGAVAGGGSPSVGASGAAGAGGMTCTTNEECPAAWLCRKTSCGDPTGHCEVRPVFCDDNFMPVCGCDHVTYWNECYRRRSGQAASFADDCTAGAHACFDSADCPVGAYCQHLLPRGISCSQTVGAGTCWVTPDVCSEAPDQMHWKACETPGDAGTGCISTCLAVQSGRPYVSVPPNGSCQ